MTVIFLLISFSHCRKICVWGYPSWIWTCLAGQLLVVTLVSNECQHQCHHSGEIWCRGTHNENVARIQCSNINIRCKDLLLCYLVSFEKQRLMKYLGKLEKKVPHQCCYFVWVVPVYLGFWTDFYCSIIDSWVLAQGLKCQLAVMERPVVSKMWVES